MAENTKIQWCDHTFNPWRGCTKIAAGCANCYADAQSKRNPRVLGIWGPNGTRVVASESMWRQPIKWDELAFNGLQISEMFPGMHVHRRPRVFCASLADVFEDWDGEVRDSHGDILHVCDSCHWSALSSVYAFGHACLHCHGFSRVATLDDVRRRLFSLIDETPNLDWLLLTKRPENVRKMWLDHAIVPNGDQCWSRRDNVWLGTSIATQADADRNIPELLKCRDLAAKLFVSVEPMIGPITLDTGPRAGPPRWMSGEIDHDDPRLDWVIVGGESGPNARPCNVAWIRSIVEQCRAAGVACFVKQLGAGSMGFSIHDLPRGMKSFIDSKGGDPSEWPVDLRVREFPC